MHSEHYNYLETRNWGSFETFPDGQITRFNCIAMWSKSGHEKNNNNKNEAYLQLPPYNSQAFLLLCLFASKILYSAETKSQFYLYAGHSNKLTIAIEGKRKTLHSGAIK